MQLACYDRHFFRVGGPITNPTLEQFARSEWVGDAWVVEGTT